MPITIVSSREFNQDLSRAKRATKDGPVFITDRGKPAHVLLSIEEYQQVKESGMSLADALAMPGSGEFGNDFDEELDQIRELSRKMNVGRSADLS